MIILSMWETRRSHCTINNKTERSFSMSKKQKSIMIILTLVTLLGVLVALFFLPDKVSLHYGVKGADPPAGLISKAVNSKTGYTF